jgi:hypothetical protein
MRFRIRKAIETRGGVADPYRTVATRSDRASELLLDCCTDTVAIDVWAAGWVLVEFGESGSWTGDF